MRVEGYHKTSSIFLYSYITQKCQQAVKNYISFPLGWLRSLYNVCMHTLFQANKNEASTGVISSEDWKHIDGYIRWADLIMTTCLPIFVMVYCNARTFLALRLKRLYDSNFEKSPTARQIPDIEETRPTNDNNCRYSSFITPPLLVLINLNYVYTSYLYA